MAKIQVNQGDTLRTVIEVFRDNVAVDLTGATIRWLAVDLWDVSVGTGIEVTGLGTALATISTAAFLPGIYRSECKVKEQDGTISTVFKTTVVILPSLIGDDL